MNLSELPLNQSGIVINLDCDSSIKRRLLDLGLVPGTSVTPIFTSPFGEPTAYEFRNTIISIRYEDCSLIKVVKDMQYMK
jgi:ferrous iron transport protein A